MLCTFIVWALLQITPQQTNQLQGTYKYQYGKAATGAFGLAKIYRINPSTVLLYLEVGRGAPDYNSGSLFEKLVLNPKTRKYENSLKSSTEGCKLELSQQNNQVIIKTVKGDCGFGYGVVADGKYYLRDKTNPQYFITLANKKVYFNKTSPENYTID